MAKENVRQEASRRQKKRVRPDNVSSLATLIRVLDREGIGDKNLYNSIILTIKIQKKTWTIWRQLR